MNDSERHLGGLRLRQPIGRPADGAWNTVSFEGKRYGMPWILDTMYLFYNKAMLAKAGIAGPPKTWAELSDDPDEQHSPRRSRSRSRISPRVERRTMP